MAMNLKDSRYFLSKNIGILNLSAKVCILAF